MIVFAWWGFPQYAARCVGAFVKASREPVMVVATKPKVPVEGMERLCGCPVKWVEDGSGLDAGELGVRVEDIRALFVSGWAIPAFNELARCVRAQGGRVICMLDNNYRFSLGECLRAIRFRLKIRQMYDGFFVPGRSGRRLLRFYGVADEKIVEGLYAADETLFHDGKPIAERAKKIVYVGQFIERKNVRRMCTAFAKACEKVESGWMLELYGSGPLKDELERIGGRRAGKIAVHDFLQPEELAEKYREARAFCLPSLEEHWGLVVHEAALSGCALLLSDRVGAAEDLLDGNGSSFDPNAERAMTDAFVRIMRQNRCEWGEMQRRSRALATKRGRFAFVSGAGKLI